ncbi:MAG: tRNA-dihydrouridine synthase, partial [Verrucomicrobia bacterium]|nr:tRNA-dihydrouridine synthase [Verrucomicrobiota bacterium]
PISIRQLRLNNRVFLAPLAGVSDVPFRRICRASGAGLVYVEMLSAEAIIHDSKRTFTMLERHPDEDVLGVQVTGPSADIVAQAVARLDAMHFDTIDINMGCPVKKIVSKGWGSAILLDPDRVSETVARCRERTALPLSVKVRLGYSRESVNVEEVVCRAAMAGADMVTVHGRVREDNYDSSSDHPAIARAVHAIRVQHTGSVVAVGNGDALNAASARSLVDKASCDAVMVARGALGNPWVFREILEGEYPAVTPDEWLDTVLRHMAWHDDLYGGGVHAAARFRKQLLWYVQGFPWCCNLRRELANASNLSVVAVRLREYADSLPPGTTRDPKFDYREGKR